jgi:hypothetical protein
MPSNDECKPRTPRQRFEDAHDQWRVAAGLKAACLPGTRSQWDRHYSYAREYRLPGPQLFNRKEDL